MKKRLFILFLVISLFIPIKAYALSGSEEVDYKSYNYKDILNYNFQNGVDYGIRAFSLALENDIESNFVTYFYDPIHQVSNNSSYRIRGNTIFSVYPQYDFEGDSNKENLYHTLGLNGNSDLYVPQETIIDASGNTYQRHDVSESNVYTANGDGMYNITDDVLLGYFAQSQKIAIGGGACSVPNEAACTNCVSKKPNGALLIDITGKGDAETVYVVLDSADYPNGININQININPYQTLVINIILNPPNNGSRNIYNIAGPTNYNNESFDITGQNNPYAKRIIYNVHDYDCTPPVALAVGTTNSDGFPYGSYEQISSEWSNVLQIDNINGILLSPYGVQTGENNPNAGWIIAPAVKIRSNFIKGYVDPFEYIRIIRFRNLIKTSGVLIYPDEGSQFIYEFDWLLGAMGWNTVFNSNNVPASGPFSIYQSSSNNIFADKGDNFTAPWRIKQIQAPEGYVVDEETLYVIPNCFDSEQLASCMGYGYGDSSISLGYYKQVSSSCVPDVSGDNWRKLKEDPCLTPINNPYFENLSLADLVPKLSFNIKKEIVDEDGEILVDNVSFPITITGKDFAEEHDIDFDYITEDMFSLKKNNVDLVKNSDYIIRLNQTTQEVYIIVSISGEDTITVNGPYATYEVEEEIDNYGSSVYEPTFYIEYAERRDRRHLAGRLYECVENPGMYDCELSSPQEGELTTKHKAIYYDLMGYDEKEDDEYVDTIWIRNANLGPNPNINPEAYKTLTIKKEYPDDSDTTFGFEIAIDLSDHNDEIEGYLIIPNDSKITSQSLDTTNHKYNISFNLKNDESIVIYYNTTISYILYERDSEAYFTVYNYYDGEGNLADYGVMENGITEIEDITDSTVMVIHNENLSGSGEDGYSITKQVKGNMSNPNDTFNFILMYDANEYYSLFNYDLKKNGTSLSSNDYEVINNNNINNYRTSAYDPSFADVLTSNCLGNDKTCMVIKNIKGNDVLNFKLLNSGYSIIEYYGDYYCSFKIDGVAHNSTYNGVNPYCQIDVSNGSDLIVINTKEGAVPTGVKLKTTLYILIIRIVLALMVLLFMFNRKRNKSYN